MVGAQDGCSVCETGTELHGISPVVTGCGFKADRIPRFGARCWLRLVRRSDLGWSPLPPSFLSSSPAKNRVSEGLAVKEESAGLVRPAAQRGHGPARLDGQAPLATVAGSVMKERGRRMTGLRPDERRIHAARRALLRAAGTPVEVSTAHSAQPVLSAGRSGAACSAVLRGAKPARRGGRQPPPGGKRSSQLFLETKDTAKKGGDAPSGYNSPRSAKLMMALPATIR